MPQYCTCGAELPLDARFCHRCGKPQREELHVDPEPDEAAEIVTPVPVAAPPPIPAEISFRNIAAVRVAFLSATIASILSSLPLPLVMCVLWLLAAGFFSVYLYYRRTGQLVSVRNGMRLGWITGVFTFVISTVLFTISMISLAGHTEDLTRIFREQLNERGLPPEMIDQAVSVLLSPVGFTVAILISLVLRFVSFAGITALGGALGARILGKD